MNLWGEKYEAQKKTGGVFPNGSTKVTPLTITNPYTDIVFFDIPKESALDFKDAKIYAFANNLEFYSEPFEINFGNTL